MELRDANIVGNSRPARDQRAVHVGHAAHDLPRVFAGAEEIQRPLPERDVQGGWRGLDLLALRMERG